ncbi:class I mannose-6-phosphate isomerase [Botryobacter ruber]|uniref:class I mannose-6-phosphate isomerase n=1 Tax=Botryobacter ruber TaxID=2171629 RepID=UPI00196A39E7|nr:class I mannose-6-phosphate isomerase [Botryobacter ruber]
MNNPNKYLKNRLPNYDKYPYVEVPEKAAQAVAGWDKVLKVLQEQLPARNKEAFVLAVDYYPGVHEQELLEQLLQPLCADTYFSTSDLFKPEQEIEQLTCNDVTDDAVFGYMTRLNLIDFFDADALAAAKQELHQAKGLTIVYGYGAALLATAPDLLIYADMPRWELQLRYRRQEISNLGLQNKGEKASLQYKRGFFVDWRVADRHKKELLTRLDYVLDTTIPLEPNLVAGEAYRYALEKTVSRPFRVVPFYDPGPWGGQWMKEVCDLDREEVNFAWCFDCVPEENSLLLKFGEVLFETPAINLVFYQSRQLLGEPVQARFGDEFPIRFDFLDTMEGGNLSLQVHPTTEYIREKFGMHYTQDESYYMLDTGKDAFVYLGLKDGAAPETVLEKLQAAQEDGRHFDAEEYVAKLPVKKHDHVLIPAGTIHCSGANSMVLEISATPYIFTFKLWDWGRLGLDGKPRPINIEHGKKVIDWSRNETFARQQLLNQVEKIAEGNGWLEERTGLHEREFIETRRHWFYKPVLHQTNGSVNVLNLVEGREAIVESPVGAFEPFVVHYAETFIVPASVGCYTIRPYGESKGQPIGTIKAYVRH